MHSTQKCIGCQKKKIENRITSPLLLETLPQINANNAMHCHHFVKNDDDDERRMLPLNHFLLLHILFFSAHANPTRFTGCMLFFLLFYFDLMVFHRNFSCIANVNRDACFSRLKQSEKVINSTPQCQYRRAVFS